MSKTNQSAIAFFGAAKTAVQQAATSTDTYDIVHKALTSEHVRAAMVERLQAICPVKAQGDAKAIAAWLKPDVAQYYEIAPVKDAAGNVVKDAAGRPTYVFTREDNGARLKLSRLSREVAGVKAKGDKDAIEVPADVLAAARKLVKLCAEYEGAGSLLAAAVAQAKAK
jgi:hypothetical protein